MTTVIFADPRHNHVKRIIDLIRKGRLAPSRPDLYEIDIVHDDWCNLLRHGGICNCSPDVYWQGTKIT